MELKFTEIQFEELRKTKFYTLNYSQEYNLLVTTWLADTREMSDEEYVEHVIFQTNCIADYGVELFLTDCRLLQFVVVPSLQEWGDDVIIADMIKSGVCKIGVVLPQDLFAQIAVEQIREEANATSVDQKTFEQKEEALEWLIAQ